MSDRGTSEAEQIKLGLAENDGPRGSGAPTSSATMDTTTKMTGRLSCMGALP